MENIMKKLTHLIMLMSMFVSMNTYAAETIKLVWPFNLGHTFVGLQALVENANREQAKYHFVLETKPGAGGSIAANFVDSNPTNSVIMTSNSFIIRPLTTKVGAHDLNKFVPVYVHQTNVPLSLVSKKYKTPQELLSKKNINIGVSSAGGISEFIAKDLMKQTNGQAVVYRGYIDAVNASMGNHVDASIGMAADTKTLIDSGNLNLLGTTGTNGSKTFNSKQFPSMKNLTMSYAVYASVNMPADKLQDMHSILNSAGLNNNVRNVSKLDNPTFPYLTYNQTQAWYVNERKYWASVVNVLF
jgi:tripartite-type tricarboxylate transporter receptor subunit TctC